MLHGFYAIELRVGLFEVVGMNYRLILGWNVRKGRLAMNMSQEKFAAEAGIGEQGSVSELECGGGNPTYSTISGAAKALDLEIPALFIADQVPSEIALAPQGTVWDRAEIVELSKKYLKRARPS